MMYGNRPGLACSDDEENGVEGVPTFAGVRSWLGILINATWKSKVTDERPPAIDFRAALERLSVLVRQNNSPSAGKHAKRYTVADTKF